MAKSNLKILLALKRVVAEEDYHGEHEAPDKASGAPMHDLTDFYPDDIYSANGARYYGDEGGTGRDQQSISIIQGARGKPKARIKIYRAVPRQSQDMVPEYEKQKAYIQKHGKVPSYVDTELDRSDYYEEISDKLDDLLANPSGEKNTGINKGDWVTINKVYAIEHGRSNLNSNYKILTKTVPASTLFTEANSIHEWGYDPS